MSKVKNKFSNEIMNDLLVRARLLPRVGAVDSNGELRYKLVKVPGYKIDKEHLKPGEVLDPKLWYTVREIVLVDHYETMVDLYRTGGQTAVLDYEQATLALKKFSNDKLRKTWYVKLHNFLTGLFKR